MSANDRKNNSLAVKSKMREFRKGERAFYEKYGGGPSLLYDLVDDEGRRYPLAAIVQAAMGAEDVRGGVKGSDSAGRYLKALGFRVIAKGKELSGVGSSFDDDLASLRGILTTEREASTKRRIGADTLRKFLLKHRIRCEVSGITDSGLLRVSHIVPWSDDDAARLDPENVILLSSLWDQAFDKGLVSFNSKGVALFSKNLSRCAKDILQSNEAYSLAINGQRNAYLRLHRAKYGFE